jgi:hypothetical protein
VTEEAQLRGVYAKYLDGAGADELARGLGMHRDRMIKLFLKYGLPLRPRVFSKHASGMEIDPAHPHVPFVAFGVRACAVCDTVLEGAG